MWTAPSPPPADGYQVQITRGSTTTTVNVVGTSHTFSVNNQYGVYSIQVIALSRPLPSEATEPVEVTVIGTTAISAYNNVLTKKFVTQNVSFLFHVKMTSFSVKITKLLCR